MSVTHTLSCVLIVAILGIFVQGFIFNGKGPSAGFLGILIAFVCAVIAVLSAVALAFAILFGQ
jgi:hypothetical protein